MAGRRNLRFLFVVHGCFVKAVVDSIGFEADTELEGLLVDGFE